MNKNQLINRLKDENARLVPDDRETVKSKLIFTEPEMDSAELTAPRRGRSKRRIWAAAISFALCLCVAIGVTVPLLFDGGNGVNPLPYHIITVDVNPTFEIKSNDGAVTSVRALDKDAAVVAATLPDLTGMPETDAVIEIIKAIQACGFFVDNKSVRLLAGGSEDEKSFNDALSAAIGGFLSANIPDVSVDNGYDDAKSKLAKKHGVPLSIYLLAERASAISGRNIKEFLDEDAEDLLEVIYGYDEKTADFGKEYKIRYKELKDRYERLEDEAEKAFGHLEKAVEKLIDAIEDERDFAPLLDALLDANPDLREFIEASDDISDALEKFIEAKEAAYERREDEIEAEFDREVELLKKELGYNS